MHVRVSTTADWNEGIAASVNSLPIRCETRVRVEAVGRILKLYLNDTLDSTVILRGDRLYGLSKLYVSNPWDISANARIKFVSMEEKYSIISYDGPLIEGATKQEGYLPVNFNITFT